MSVSKGLFITLEGTEGTGKSTLIRGLAWRFSAQGIEPVMTREPGGPVVAEKIREVLLSTDMDRRTELFLYQAARAEHLAKVLKPALEKGSVVLCDRFTDSSLAYQAHARGLPWAEVKSLNHLATEGLVPHLTLWLDLDPAVGLSRAQEITRFEKEGLEFQKKVRAGFKRAMKDSPRRWLRLPMDKLSPEAAVEMAWKEILKRFGKKLPKTRTRP